MRQLNYALSASWRLLSLSIAPSHVRHAPVRVEQPRMLHGVACENWGVGISLDVSPL